MKAVLEALLWPSRTWSWSLWLPRCLVISVLAIQEIQAAPLMILNGIHNCQCLVKSTNISQERAWASLYMTPSMQDLEVWLNCCNLFTATDSKALWVLCGGTMKYSLEYSPNLCTCLILCILSNDSEVTELLVYVLGINRPLQKWVLIFPSAITYKTYM